MRPRVYGYLEALREAGIEGRVAPFLSDAAFRRFYDPGPGGVLWKAAGTAAGYVRRWRLLSRLDRYDVVVVHREVVPRGNGPVLRRLKESGIPLVYDLDDAIYLHPRDFVAGGDDSRRSMNRGKDPAEVDAFLEGADLVLAGNSILADHARTVGARRIEILPTPVDTEAFRPADPVQRDGPLLVGWIGSPTATYCLREIAPAHAPPAARVPVRRRGGGGGGGGGIPGVEVIRRAWALDRECSDYASLDVGIYPLPDNPWTRGKCGYKALLYAACGLPCVASPVGVNREFVRDGETGFHASTGEEWTARLLELLSDAALRRRMGGAGRRFVEGAFSYAVLAPRMVAALRGVAR